MSTSLVRARLNPGVVLTALAAAVLALAPVERSAAQAAAPASAASQPAGPTVRPEVALPLGAAQQLLGEGKAAEAMAKVEEAARLPALSPFETYALERTRAAVAQRQGDVPLVMKALEAALATGQTPPADEVALLEAMVSTSARQGDHAGVLRWSQRYVDLKGPNDAVRVVRIQSQLASGDAAGAKAALLARLDAADKAGQALPEVQLRLLLGAQQRTSDAAGQVRTLERLAGAYPRPEYWADVISMAARDPNLSDRALLDLYRLMRSTGNLRAGDLRDEMAQLAQRLGQPGEALVIVEEGFASGQLGTGAKAAEHQKLREQLRRLAGADRSDRASAETAARRAADGNALADLGWTIVASEPAGAAPGAIEQGLALIEQGIAKGGLRRATETQLRLAMAQLAAGRKDAARQTLAGLAGTPAGDGLGTAVRLWSLYAQAPAMLPSRN